MDAVLESNYQLMRFNVVNSAIPNLQESPFDPEYVFAWQHGVYPAFSDGAELHLPFEQNFRVSKEEVLELGSYLDEIWLSNKTISFYELESHYDVRSGGNWDRIKLLYACRYMRLNRMFDDSFWAKVTENGECPSEALSLANPIQQSDIHLM